MTAMPEIHGHRRYSTVTSELVPDLLFIYRVCRVRLFLYLPIFANDEERGA